MKNTYGLHEECEIFFDLEQGTDEWLNTRKTLCTSSEEGLLAGTTGFKTYLIKKEAEKYLEVVSEGYSSKAMNDGTDLEPTAARAFEQEKLISLTEVGFIRRADIGAGWSPDRVHINKHGIIDFAVEIKCRQATGHYRVIKNGLDKKTYNQMQHAMAITNIPMMYYIGFNPDFVKEKQLIIIKVMKLDAAQTIIVAACKNVKNIINA